MTTYIFLHGIPIFLIPYSPPQKNQKELAVLRKDTALPLLVHPIYIFEIPGTFIHILSPF